MKTLILMFFQQAQCLTFWACFLQLVLLVCIYWVLTTNSSIFSSRSISCFRESVTICFTLSKFCRNTIILSLGVSLQNYFLFFQIPFSLKEFSEIVAIRMQLISSVVLENTFVGITSILLQGIRMPLLLVSDVLLNKNMLYSLHSYNGIYICQIKLIIDKK